MRGRKLFLPYVAAAALALAACSGGGGTPDVKGTTGVPTLTPITPTETVTAPPTTVTVTNPAPPVETAKPKQPVVSCPDVNWDTTRDTPSREELQLKPGATVERPMVDAPLIGVNAWPSNDKCYDTVEFVIDTTMIDPSVRDNEVNYTDHPWFDVQYVDQVATEGSGFPVALNGNASLQVVVYAKAASYVHSSGHVPTGLVNAATYDRWTGFPSVREIKGAGEFEGQFTFGIGVDQRRPFAAYYVDNNDGTTSVVVRVVH